MAGTDLRRAFFEPALATEDAMKGVGQRRCQGQQALQQLASGAEAVKHSAVDDATATWVI